MKQKKLRKPTVTNVKSERRRGAVGTGVAVVVVAVVTTVVAVPVARRCGGGCNDIRLPPAIRCSALFKMAGGDSNRRPSKKARQI